MSSVLEKAIRLATSAHAGQVDKLGQIYILHPLRVMFAAETTYNQTPVLGFTLEEFMAAAVLHDVSEDVPEYPLSYIHAQFGVNIHDIVEGVTRHLGEEYKEFILRACENEGSRRLKLVDIRDNLSRIHLLPKAMSKLQHRYIQAEKVLLSYSNKA